MAVALKCRGDEIDPTLGNVHAVGASINAVTSAISSSTSAQSSAIPRLLDLEKAFVFGEVAFPVRGVEDPPAGRRPAESVFEALEDRVSVFASIAVPAQRRQGS